MKICTKCQLEKEETLFYKDKKGKMGLHSQCKSCLDKTKKEYRGTHKHERSVYENNQNSTNPLWKKEKAARNARYYTKLKSNNSTVLVNMRDRSRTFLRNLKKNNPAYFLWKSAKHRSVKNNLPFDLSLEDIIIPKNCPILEIELFVGIGKTCNNSPSIDRIIPELGYVRSNIKVISHLANAMKNSASSELLEKFSKNIINYINNKDIVQTTENVNL